MMGIAKSFDYSDTGYQLIRGTKVPPGLTVLQLSEALNQFKNIEFSMGLQPSNSVACYLFCINNPILWPAIG